MPRLSKIGAAALAAFGWTTGGASVSASYLVVAGGGSGGGAINAAGQGGGGAGGMQTGTTYLSAASSYTVTVGSGGAAGTSQGTNGSNSQFGTLTASVGGGGGGMNNNGSAGGSGGGAGNGFTSAALGTAGQGNNGGTAASGGSSPYASGGGGGAGAVGGNSSGGTAGSGGAGSASSITGSSVTYAGGGGGGVRTSGTAGSGGSGGGGAGTATTDTNGNPGTANLGGGGGGSSQGAPAVYGGQGGSGIVIVSYAGAQKFTGGTITTSGGNTIHTFTSSGALTAIGMDSSPQGNNWTPNNISLTAGSTYDSMTDVPTLTSATTANYCVLNPLASTASTITNGNLTFTCGNSRGFRGSFWVSSGKWYWEATLVSGTPSTTSVGGVMDTTYPNATGTVDIYVTTAGWTMLENGSKYNGSGGSAYGSSYTIGDVIGVALDMDNGKIWWSINGVFQASGNPAAGTNAAFTNLSGKTITPSSDATTTFPTVVLGYNFGQQPFTYTPPSGFLALNTYNI